MLVSATFKLNLQRLHETVKNRAILQLYQHEDSDCGRLAPAECHLQRLQAGCGAHVACATRLRRRQAFSRTLVSQKQLHFVTFCLMGPKLRYTGQRYQHYVTGC